MRLSAKSRRNSVVSCRGVCYNGQEVEGSMGKRLSEMTLEELWRLFPIFLTEHKPCWSEWYDVEVGLLKGILPQDLEYFHIGSTAIGGIMAKPIIDILIAAESKEQLKLSAGLLNARGYIIMSESENRISLNKGYTESGFAERVFHIHLRLKGDCDEVYFRDYLIAHPEIAGKYEQLKLRLWREYEHNRDAYTDAKTEFVKKYTEISKQDAGI